MISSPQTYLSTGDLLFQENPVFGHCEELEVCKTTLLTYGQFGVRRVSTKLVFPNT